MSALHDFDPVLGRDCPIPEDPSPHAAWLREKVGLLPERPCRLGPICDLLRVEIRRVELDPEVAGTPALLAPVEGGFRAIFARCFQAPPEIVRLILAHEIGHTLFYDRAGSTPRRQLPTTPEEEIFCDRFADALLLPTVVLERLRSDREQLGRVAEHYRIPLQAAVTAAARAWDRDVVVGLREEGNLPFVVLTDDPDELPVGATLGPSTLESAAELTWWNNYIFVWRPRRPPDPCRPRDRWRWAPHPHC